VFTQVSALLVGAAGILGSLVYIARLVGRGVRLLEQLAGLPDAHAQLAAQTEDNTRAIRWLTTEVRRLADAEAAKRLAP
jgi:hypothetical protein